MLPTKTVVQVLGGPKILRLRSWGVAELGRVVRVGLPYESLEAVAVRCELTRAEAATILHLPMRTLARRKRERKLRPEESDRLFRLARVAGQAAEVLGSEDRAAKWLRRSNRALGNEAPLKLLDTDIGTKQVEDVLTRIEAGAYS